MLSFWFLKYVAILKILICSVSIAARLLMTIFMIALLILSHESSELIAEPVLFMGEFNFHHSDWLGSHSTDAHGRAAYDFVNLTNCSQLVRGPTHVAGGTLDLVMSDVPELVDVVVGSSIGASDHYHMSI